VEPDTVPEIFLPSGFTIVTLSNRPLVAETLTGAVGLYDLA
jgi:hypothetical protein